MKLAIIGYGKMGRLIEALAANYGFDVQLRLNSENNSAFESLTAANFAGVEAAVEFSAAPSAPENLKRLAAIGIPTVTGTTGWRDRLPEVQKAVQQSGGGLVWSSNYSVGVCVFTHIVSEAARMLAAQEDYSAWAWEIHHSAKKDAPSGTLNALLERIRKSGFERPIDTGSNRAGFHPGTHEIGFDSPSDTITLRHTARSREGFARGALRAARWVIGKKGVFEFSQIIGELG